MARSEPIEIKPFAVYTAQEAADILRVDRKKIYNLVDTRLLVSSNTGKTIKFLGENILRFMGSPSIARMKPDVSSEDLDK